MSNISLVKDFHAKVRALFSQVILKLEIKEYSNTYVVDVAPLDVYNNDLYIEIEQNFRDQFEQENPDASIVFVSENSLLRADNPILNFLPTIDIAREIEIKNTFKYSTNNENYSIPHWGYALAA